MFSWLTKLFVAQDGDRPKTTSSGAPETSQINKPADDFAEIVAHVMGVLVSAVRNSDCSAEYFSQKLPTTWDDPSIVGTTRATKGFEGASDFLNEFHTKYYRDKSFAVEVGTPSTITLPGGSMKTLQVIWVNQDHCNVIHVKHQDCGSGTTGGSSARQAVDLMKFYDSDAIPRSESFAGNESVSKYLHEANPSLPKLIKKANPTVRERIVSTTDSFNRAVYAVIDRKRMKQKPKAQSSAQQPVKASVKTPAEDFPPYDMPYPYDGGGWQRVFGSDGGIQHFQRTCPACNGEGRIDHADCRFCKGSGWQRIGRDWQQWCP